MPRLQGELLRGRKDARLTGWAVVVVFLLPDFFWSGVVSTLGATRIVTMLRYRTGVVWCLRPKTKTPTATQVSRMIPATSRHRR